MLLFASGSPFGGGTPARLPFSTPLELALWKALEMHFPAYPPAAPPPGHVWGKKNSARGSNPKKKTLVSSNYRA
jgi:hypothetical protein